MKTIRNISVLTFLVIAATSATLGFIVIGAVLAASASDKPNVPPVEHAAALQETTNIVFTRFVYEKDHQNRFVISDPKAVGKLISSMRLKPGVALRDEHSYGATFQGSSGETSVSLCPRCFTIHGQDSSRIRTYEMPKDFYAEFRRLARQHGWKVERK